MDRARTKESKRFFMFLIMVSFLYGILFWGTELFLGVGQNLT